MSLWGSIAKALSRLSGAGARSSTWTKTWTADGVRNVMTVVNGAGGTVLTWANAAKVAIVGAFSYLFLTGGASNVVSGVLGISPEAAQVLIVFGFVVLMILATRYLVNWAVSRYGLDRSKLEEPIVKDVGLAVWDDDRRSWVRRRA